MAVPAPVAEASSVHPSSSDRAAQVEAAVGRILSTLDEAGIPWCVLRNRDRIPSGLLEWDDLDVMIPDDISRNRLVELFAPLGPTQIIPIRAGFTALFFPAADLMLRVDLYHGDLEWRAAAYGLNREIVAARGDDDGIMVASDLHQAFLAWFSRLLREKSFKERYAPKITRAMTEHPVAFRELLVRTFGARMADHLVTLATTGRLGDCDEVAGELRRLVWLHAWRRRPLDTTWRAVRQIADAVEHRMRPTGLDVALLGPDGSGKTSLCEAIAALPSRRVPFASVRFRKLYHRVLPTLGDLEGKIRRKPRRAGIDATRPQGSAAWPTPVWALFQAYYTVDQWLGEIIWNRRQLAHGSLVLHDRHLLEVVIDPRRYRYAGPMWIAKWFARLAPQPDLIIVLDAPAEVIQPRKQEITLEETERQRREFRALANSLPHARLVDANQPFETVLDHVLAEIAASVADRTRRRFHLGRPSRVVRLASSGMMPAGKDSA